MVVEYYRGMWSLEEKGTQKCSILEFWELDWSGFCIYACAFMQSTLKEIKSFP